MVVLAVSGEGAMVRVVEGMHVARALWSWSCAMSAGQWHGYRQATPSSARRARCQGCITRERASEAAREVVRQTVGGGCQSDWGRLLSVTNAVEAGTWRQGDSGRA